MKRCFSLYLSVVWFRLVGVCGVYVLPSSLFFPFTVLFYQFSFTNGAADRRKKKVAAEDKKKEQERGQHKERQMLMPLMPESK